MKKVINNKEKSRLELHIGEHFGFLDYKMKGDNMYFIHTEVPEELKGQGIANFIAETTLRYAKENGYNIIVYCPFIKTYLKRHPMDYDKIEIR